MLKVAPSTEYPARDSGTHNRTGHIRLHLRIRNHPVSISSLLRNLSIEVITGLVLDFHVVSTFCHACSFAKTKYGSGIEFEEWYLKHKPHCNINFSGSSNAMEVEAAKVLWSRSLDSGFRYSTLISDGDSKSYDHINNLKLYNVEKQECINHVAKRMGTALRKLAKDGKKLGVVLGGKGQGKLTQTTINKLTIYYGKAIRENLDNLDAMRDAVYASFLHALSTDAVPHHNRCPKGINSWCFYQRAVAVGEKPGSHSELVHTPISLEVGDHLKTVYERLGSEALLRRCLGGFTQNPNESLHAINLFALHGLRAGGASSAAIGVSLIAF
ncbi:hypothetical protein LOTGIDRAFT_165443 [Lottia gigantea]|uniref:Mutator-like transposase domain-containing protein n=1 Tax=Lottia gigantea TaxID=225164 RepID=V4BIY5_LOTGI|nr:hypothetical protein LOTGIDRAFT_165443 [Lottia gigantea]ESO88659.1 hypothetical protein LOTGIDRAFT_165443 [Lottia gigantea]